VHTPFSLRRLTARVPRAQPAQELDATGRRDHRSQRTCRHEVVGGRMPPPQAATAAAAAMREVWLDVVVLAQLNRASLLGCADSAAETRRTWGCSPWCHIVGLAGFGFHTRTVKGGDRCWSCRQPLSCGMTQDAESGILRDREGLVKCEIHPWPLESRAIDSSLPIGRDNKS
jgi:hypothetical protein